jgi:hypothetical protein
MRAHVFRIDPKTEVAEDEMPSAPRSAAFQLTIRSIAAVIAVTLAGPVAAAPSKAGSR